MPKVTQLGHVGIFVRDIDTMIEFYSEFLGMTVTDTEPGRITFLSAHPETEHHELVLSPNEKRHTDPQQLSFQVASLADLREFYRQIVERQYEIDHVVSHGNALGCYFYDPEHNQVEVYWQTGIKWAQPYSQPIDLFRSEADLLQMLDDMVAAGPEGMAQFKARPKSAAADAEAAGVTGR